jgi:ATPase subunit of ABC transporter with duplicated ATPase domains
MSSIPRGSLVTLERVSFRLADGHTLLSDLTLGFGRERTGLAGANGSGKTTLARLVAGELHPSDGAVLRRARVGYLPQGVSLDARRPLAEALGIATRLEAVERVAAGSTDPADFTLASTAWDLRERAEALLARFGLGHLRLDRAAGTVSGGEATRAALAGLLLDEPEFLVLDEPTNHLDAASRQALYRFVEGWRGGMLVISHDRALLRRVDRILELSGLGARLFGGAYDAYREQRDTEAAAAEQGLAHARTEARRAAREAQVQRERQERRSARGRRSRATANHSKLALDFKAERSERTGARLDDLAERRIAESREAVAAARARVDERERLVLALAPTGLPAGKTVLEVDGVSVRLPGASRPLLRGLSLRLAGPERVALTGPNGSGKTTLLRLVLGETAPEAGSVRLGLDPAEVGYLDQRLGRLEPDESVLGSFRGAYPRMTETEARHALARFLFREDEVLKQVRVLSGGERLRLALACVVGGPRPPALLLLDEPTNHLDLDSLAALEGVLRGYDGALLVASHDEEFLEAIGIERRVELGAPLPANPSG